MWASFTSTGFQLRGVSSEILPCVVTRHGRESLLQLQQRDYVAASRVLIFIPVSGRKSVDYLYLACPFLVNKIDLARPRGTGTALRTGIFPRTRNKDLAR